MFSTPGAKLCGSKSWITPVHQPSRMCTQDAYRVPDGEPGPIPHLSCYYQLLLGLLQGSVEGVHVREGRASKCAFLSNKPSLLESTPSVPLPSVGDITDPGEEPSKQPSTTEQGKVQSHPNRDTLPLPVLESLTKFSSFTEDQKADDALSWAHTKVAVVDGEMVEP